MINKEIRKTLVEMIPVLTFCMCFGTTAGILLNYSGDILEKELMVGILIITPSIMALGGYISSIFSMRLTTALYSGIIEPKIKRSTFIENNFIALFILSVIISVIIGVLSYLIVIWLGSPTNLSIFGFLFLSVVGGLIDFVVCLLATIPIAFISFYKGLDPDNLTTPILNSLSDMFSVISIFIALQLYISIFP